MEAFGLYLLKSTLVSGIFYLFYHAFLRKESFFSLSRFYLLSSVAFAFLYPLVSIKIEHRASQPLALISTIQSTINQFEFAEEPTIVAIENVGNTTSYINWWLLPIALVSIAFLFRFLKNIIQLRKTIYANETIKEPQFTLVLFNQHYTFSFFRYIFISQTVWRSPNGSKIINHELSHLKHRHSIDRLIMELLLIVFWMNPFLYFYRKALEEVHEFQADADATKHVDQGEYFGLVLQQSSVCSYSPLMSPFSYKLIKKRIKMANYKSHPHTKFRIIIPMLIGAVILLTSAINVRTLQSNNSENSILEINNETKNIPSESTFITPVSNGNLAAGWGFRIHPIYKVKKFHEGLDYSAPLNTPVFASQSGVVILTKSEKTGYGKRIEVEHKDSYKTLYAHLNSFNVKEGQAVKQGDIIGYVGSSGGSTTPHLHFEVHQNDKKINPANLLVNISIDKPIELEDDLFIAPIAAKDLIKTSSGYGMRVHPISKKKMMHNGVDYVAELNTNVVAIGDGVVRKVNHDFVEGKGHGRFVIVDHENGYSSFYSQLNAYKVKEGQKVKQGDVVGLLGSSGLSTGPHLHMEIKKDGHFIDPESVIK
ncbi:peptidoglycan DD-metalloendopeptidase family protein [Carboxylicivirga mesophila]|uniref:Peptidoglycan DD-metalloendopeptidase family protein n=1 Tax=Carboxylicivirga mesophila TaxID=1166478 RepID=A0ABS5KEZ5_9BACT|nr:peptidoglycan DD-metalloendopeptidase family protein [Carboxylicivirga mesophila]MBS2213628.1 peptidoglycan DD-metalloendopeptidase family protein [Carboxylicivirga mesophila]